MVESPTRGEAEPMCDVFGDDRRCYCPIETPCSTIHGAPARPITGSCRLVHATVVKSYASSRFRPWRSGTRSQVQEDLTLDVGMAADLVAGPDMATWEECCDRCQDVVQFASIASHRSHSHGALIHQISPGSNTIRIRRFGILWLQ